MNQAGKPIAGPTANALAIGHVLFIEHDSTGGRKWVITRCIQVVNELLDARLMEYRRMGIRRARRRFSRIHSAETVYLIHLLGLRVIGLHVLVADRPSRRNPIVFAQFSEILSAQAVQGRAVHFGCAAHKVVDLWLEWFPVAVVPGVRRNISVVDKDGLGIPIQGLAPQPVTAFENQDALAGGRQGASQRTAAGAAPDNDHIVIVWHRNFPSQPWAALHETAIGEN